MPICKVNHQEKIDVEYVPILRFAIGYFSMTLLKNALEHALRSNVPFLVLIF